MNRLRTLYVYLTHSLGGDHPRALGIVHKEGNVVARERILEVGKQKIDEARRQKGSMGTGLRGTIQTIFCLAVCFICS